MAGYSGTPLAKKLGIREGAKVAVLCAPANYRGLLEPLPADVVLSSRLGKDAILAHVFTASRDELARVLAACRKTLRDDAVVWVSWPKKASKLQSDVDENVIREVALPMGFVDIKVCAVDETWSGLKLVVRKILRGRPEPGRGVTSPRGN